MSLVITREGYVRAKAKETCVRPVGRRKNSPLLQTCSPSPLATTFLLITQFQSKPHPDLLSAGRIQSLEALQMADPLKALRLTHL